MGELMAALRANDPDLFRQWLSGGVQDLGEPVVEELLLDWLDPCLTVKDQHSYGLEAWQTMQKTGWRRCPPPVRA